MRIAVARGLVLLGVAGGCAAAAPAGDSKAGAEAANRFAARVFEKLAAEAKGNLFFSPYSIHAALAMVNEGAHEETARQFLDTLDLPADPAARSTILLALQSRLEEVRKKGEVTLDIANRVWSQKSYPLLADFTGVIERTFGAGFVAADFAGDFEGARREINAWVEKQTRDRIRDLIKPGLLNELTRMVLVNAIYFYGSWQTPFAAEATKDQPFHLADGRSVPAPLMHAQLEGLPYAEIEGGQACEIPYRGRDLAMLVLLPKPGGLAGLEARVAKDGVDAVAQGLRGRKVRLYLPRFKVEQEFKLNDALQAVGIRDAFDVRRADFTGMTGNRDLYLSAVVHKAFVEVNEKGTEAAAATGAIMALRSAAPRPEEPVEFRADRPFVFAIVDRRSRAILFLGRVADPGGR